MNKENIALSSLVDSPSLMEFLLYLSPSKNLVKKYFDKKKCAHPVRKKDSLLLPIDFMNHLIINPHYEGPEIEIIFEDDLFLVMSKPPQIYVHPLSYSEKNNCLSFLRDKKPSILNVNESQYDRGLLYRLDFETSGVLVYVKNKSLHELLRAEFKTLIKSKIYWAIVEGDFRFFKGEAVHWLRASEKNGMKMKAIDPQVVRECDFHAQSKMKCVEYCDQKKISLVEIELITGHRHQIRAQLSAMGFSIIGDELYGGAKASRMYLHAKEYKIEWADFKYLFQSNPLDFFAFFS